MKRRKTIKQDPRVHIIEGGGPEDDGFRGIFGILGGPMMSIIVSWGGGWEHASASWTDRTPFWEEMCALKDAIWKPSETVIQYHPPADQYVNHHPFCLHLWRAKSSRKRPAIPPRYLIA